MSSIVPTLVDQVGEVVDHLVEVEMVVAAAHHTTTEVAEVMDPHIDPAPPLAVLEAGDVTAAQRAVEDLLEDPAAADAVELRFENGRRTLNLESWHFTRRWTLSKGNGPSRRTMTKINVHWPT